MITDILILLIQLIFVPLAAPLCIGITRNIKAKLQNRQGAGILQPYRDLKKLFYKDEITSKDASWVFTWAPYVVFSVTVVVGASIPLFASFMGNWIFGDLLLVVYALAIDTFFLALAGMDTGSAFGGFGSSREMTMSALAEGGFIFSLLTMALVSGSTNLFAVSHANALMQSPRAISAALVFFGFCIVALAETARFPFDNPATHLELTMIHEAMILEYSGKKLALMEWASANKLLIFIALAANLFFPFGLAQSATIIAVVAGIITFIIKMAIFCLAIAILESSMAKFRFFRLPDLLLLSFVLNVVAIILIF